MKHSPLLGIVMLALAFAAGSIALAADYHMGTTLHCSDCHNMHGSLTHGQDGNPANPALVGGPTTFLLKGADPNSMCLACHDGTTLAPDVMGANTGSFVREAGGLPTGTTPYESWKGHSLGSMATAPGGTFSNPTGLECVDCHNQHGVSSVTGFPVGYTNGQWRNLKNKPGGSANNTPITYAIGTNDPTKDVFERDATLGQFSTHYSINNVDFNEPNTTSSAYANWCKGCHTNFHGTVGGTEIGGVVTTGNYIRHPAEGVDIGALGGGHSSISRWNATGKTNWVKVMDPAGLWQYSTATSGATGNYTPSCFSCHKAHGNQNPYGLIEMRQTGTVTEEGTADGVYTSLCTQCHVQGTP